LPGLSIVSRPPTPTDAGHSRNDHLEKEPTIFTEQHYDTYCQVRSSLNALGAGAPSVRHALAYGDVLAVVDALHPDITHIEPTSGDRHGLYTAARAGIGALPLYGIDTGAALIATADLDAAWQLEKAGGGRA
jgi:hypothetical protein